MGCREVGRSFASGEAGRRPQVGRIMCICGVRRIGLDFRDHNGSLTGWILMSLNSSRAGSRLVSAPPTKRWLEITCASSDDVSPCHTLQPASLCSRIQPVISLEL